MKFKYIFLIFLSTSFKVLFAQQNFFNVPSSDITPNQKLFFQQQLNFTTDNLQGSTTLCYGLGKNYEIGINLLDVVYVYKQKKILLNDTTVPYLPFFALNAQKKFPLSDRFSVAIGGQLASTNNFKTAIYAYSNSIYYIKETKTKIVSGFYYTSDSYFGEETRNFSDNAILKKVGFQAGIEQYLWKNKLLFQIDFISGKHSAGEIVFGGAYFINKNWVISTGYQIPTFGSLASKALILEITFVPKSSE